VAGAPPWFLSEAIPSKSGGRRDDSLLTGARLRTRGDLHHSLTFERRSVAKPELGTKRLCPSCSTKYYDFGRDPILCPKCGTVFTAAIVPLRAKAAVVEEEEVETEEALPVDFVSLEEADAEASGGEEVPEIEDEEIADIGEDLGDDTFLEPEDDEDIDGIDIDVAPEDEER